MRKVLKVVSNVVAALIVALAVAVSLTIGWRPFIGPRSRPLTNRTFERTAARLARGQYLVELVGCFDCHGERDWTKHDAPLIEGTQGAGSGDSGKAAMEMRVFGRIIPANITPDPETGVGTWTDDMLARAIREGIGHDGRALFPAMRYENLRHLSDEDLASVVVYIRSIPPIRKALPKTKIIFPVNYLIRSTPQPIEAPVPQPDSTTPAKRGEYLVTLGDCATCHTPQVKYKPIPGLQFAGGDVLEVPGGRVASANITPDPSGISYYDEAMFIGMMRTGYVRARKISPVMPWYDFRNLTDDDLKGIFAYLRTLKPVKHRVDNTEPPTYCRLCGSSHGAGNKN